MGLVTISSRPTGRLAGARRNIGGDTLGAFGPHMEPYVALWFRIVLLRLASFSPARFGRF